MTAWLGGCAAPGPLLLVKHPLDSSIVLQAQLPDVNACNVIADEIDPRLRSQADKIQIAGTPRFAECLSLSYSDKLSYEGQLQFPGLDTPVTFYALSQRLCEEAGKPLIARASASGCHARNGSAVTPAPGSGSSFLQIRRRGLPVVFAEVELRTHALCEAAKGKRYDAYFDYWCVPDSNRSAGLAQPWAARMQHDRFNDGLLPMRAAPDVDCKRFQAELTQDRVPWVIDSCEEPVERRAISQLRGLQR